MISRETIQSILEVAVQAPSGENAQPWKFTVAGDAISIFNVPENDRSLYNFGQRASYIAHGAVIENIEIAASHYGLGTTIETFPDKNNPELIARILLKESGVTQDPLYDFISKRSTNRKPYKTDPVAPEFLAKLSEECQRFKEVELQWVTDGPKITELSTIASTNDRLLLENRSLHDFFFSHVHWTLEEEQQKRSGFYIEVLELLPPAKVMFRFFKNWSLMKVFNALGAAKMGAKENSKIYAAASAIGILSITDENNNSFVNVGRSLQRLWLLLTSKGISLQPLTGILFFHQRMEAKEDKDFSPEQKNLIEEAYKNIASIFNINNEIITMMFRIGYAEPPTATSLKTAPIIIFE